MEGGRYSDSRMYLYCTHQQAGLVVTSQCIAWSDTNGQGEDAVMGVIIVVHARFSTFPLQKGQALCSMETRMERRRTAQREGKG
jgi:hypothetical protein